MAAYWVASVKVTNPDKYKEYAARAPAALEKYGGKFLARGGRHAVLEGDMGKNRVVVLQFDSVERALECYNSPEYQAAMAHRIGAADVQLAIVESL
jgi:uncharacterized protein (DUF1330 family)